MGKLIGTDPSQVPSNADLGTIAYQNADALGNITASSATLGGRTTSTSGQIDLTITRSVGGGGALKLIGDGYLTGGSHVIFEHTASSGASATTQNISYDGTQIYTNGNFKVSGLTFGATSSSPSGYTINNNTMDDYEEGTWTPIPRGTTTGSSTDAAFTSPAGHQNGHYTKIGQTVHYSMMLYGTNFNGTGTFEIHGLPFSLGGAAATAAVQANNPPWATLGADNQNITAYPTVNKIAFRATSRNGGGNMVVAQCGGSTTVGYVRISGVYHTND
jgi:hypothetical protein